MRCHEWCRGNCYMKSRNRFIYGQNIIYHYERSFLEKCKDFLKERIG